MGEAIGDWPCLVVRGAVVQLAVSVQPGAKRTGAAGLHDGCLRVRLAAPPIEGRANRALIEWLADELGLPRRAVTLLRGDTARRKLLAIDAPVEQVARWLASGLAAQQ